MDRARFGVPKGFAQFRLPRSQRIHGEVYFCRISGDSDLLRQWLGHLRRDMGSTPLYAKGHLSNPSESHMVYFRQRLGLHFSLDQASLEQQLAIWIPTLDEAHRRNLACEMAQELAQSQSKKEGILRNICAKWMCWMYYQLQQVVHHLGQDRPPCLLVYQPTTAHEFQFYRLLGRVGCDVIFLDLQGDEKSRAMWEEVPLCDWAGVKPFPPDFSLMDALSEKVESEPPSKEERRGGDAFSDEGLNSWLSSHWLEDAKKPPSQRGPSKALSYTMFVRLLGVEDRSSYQRELALWKRDLEGLGRKVILWEELPIPTPGEAAVITRDVPQSVPQLASRLGAKLWKSQHEGWNRRVQMAMLDVLESCQGEPLRRIQNKGIYLVCWFNRYGPEWFAGDVVCSTPVLIYFGLCRTQFEALFLRFLGRLPVDLLEIYPKTGCQMEDPLLRSHQWPHTLPLQHFPSSLEGSTYSTVAYHAEGDVKEMLYQGTPLGTPAQKEALTAIGLETMYEEVGLLWDKEALYRPGFQVLEDQVLVPVLAAKISGVTNGTPSAHWAMVRHLLQTGGKVLYFPQTPLFQPKGSPPSRLTSLLQQGKIQTGLLTQHPHYPYRLLRPQVQQRLWSQVQHLLDGGWIEGTFSKGVEYLILSVALRLPEQVLQLLQGMESQGCPPKCVVVMTGAEALSLEDSIFLALLHVFCFDVLLLVPTGYQVVEQHFARPLFQEHHIGPYVYDLQAPALGDDRDHFLSRLFRRRHP